MVNRAKLPRKGKVLESRAYCLSEGRGYRVPKGLGTTICCFLFPALRNDSPIAAAKQLECTSSSLGHPKRDRVPLRLLLKKRFRGRRRHKDDLGPGPNPTKPLLAAKKDACWSAYYVSLRRVVDLQTQRSTLTSTGTWVGYATSIGRETRVRGLVRYRS